MHAQVWDAWQRFIQPLVSKVGLPIHHSHTGCNNIGYKNT